MTDHQDSSAVLVELQSICDQMSAARANGQGVAKLLEQFHVTAAQLSTELIKESFLTTRIALADAQREKLRLVRGVSRLSASAKALATVQRLSSEEASGLSSTLTLEDARAFYKSKAGVHNEVATVCEALHAQCLELLKQE